jgi:hypothetical protein
MLRHAFGSGLQVPPALVEIAAQVEGCGVPGATGTPLGDLPLDTLAQLHSQLARLMAPATPRTIQLLDADPQRGSLWAVLGPLPNVWRLTYRVLMRLVDTVESLFKGDQKELQRRQEDLHRANAQQATVQTRVDVAEQLIGLRDEVVKGASPDRLNEKLTAVLNDLLKRNAGTGTATSAAPPRPDAH